MSKEMIEMLILAAIAGFVVFRLYSVLGRRTGSERPQPRPVRTGAATPEPVIAPRPPAPSASAGSGRDEAPGFADIARADPNFDSTQFLAGARAAYELIVGAFAQGDRETLKNLLTPKVFGAFDGAIAARAETGAPGPELVRLKSAELLSGRLDGKDAKIEVRFEAELAEGASGLRDARERWTFQRDVSSRDPNWLLAAVAQA